MSLTAQLKAFATAVSSSYAVDNVKRKSLIYEDPSKIDTLSCYQQEDFIRCILPYHETGLFSKFAQLINYRSVSSQFMWMKKYAESGKGVSRQEFARLCIREHSLVPFICTSILKFVELFSEEAIGLLNDVANFFLVTVTALCDSSISDKKLIEILDLFQGVICQGLKAAHIPSFQCASFLVVLRFNLKLPINHELIFDWILYILRNTNAGKEWESVRLIMQLMRNQSIPILPPKLTSRFDKLMSKLSENERQIIEKEESGLLNHVDANELAMSSKNFAHVANATQFMDISLSTKQLPSDQISSESSKSNVAVDELHAFIASLPDIGTCIMNNADCVCPKEPIQKTDKWLSNVILSLFPTDLGSNTMLSCNYSKNKICEDLKYLNYFKFVVHLAVKTVHCTSNKRSRRSISSNSDAAGSSPTCTLLMKGIDHALPLLVVCLSHPTPAFRVEAYNILISSLKQLTDHFDNLEKFPNLNTFLACLKSFGLSNDLENTFTEDVKELLRGDSLLSLGKSALTVLTASAKLLYSQPFEAGSDQTKSSYSSICWFYGLHLLNEHTVNQLFATSSPNTGWSFLLHLIKSPQEPYKLLHELVLARFTQSLFHSLNAAPPSYMTAKLANQDMCQVQTEVLDAVCELGLLELANMKLVEQLLVRLQLDAVHFDYLLIKCDSSKTVTHGSKSLFKRVNESRLSGRDCIIGQFAHPDDILMQSHLSADWKSGQKCTWMGAVWRRFSRYFGWDFIMETMAKSLDRLRYYVNLELMKSQARRSISRNSLSTDHSTMANANGIVPYHHNHRTESLRLRFVSVLLSVLINAVGRIQQKEMQSVVTVKGFNSDSDKKSNRVAKVTDATPVHDLITPLVNHLISILNKEQHFKKSLISSNKIDNLDSSDSDEHDDDDDVNEAIEEDLPVNSVELDDTTQSNSLRALLRQCVYRILVCMTAILTEGNRSRRSRKKRTLLRVGNSGLLCGPVSVQAVCDPVFLCLTIYPDWVSLHQEILMCFIELSTMFPQVLCHRLISLVQWVACNHQLMRLDNSHSLGLLGRLIVVAVPALIRTSSDRISASLNVLTLFVDQFSTFPSHLGHRRLALYAGLMRGLAQVTNPTAAPVDQSDKRQLDVEPFHHQATKDHRLGSWLWVASLIFLNKNWDNEDTAEQVGSFLVDVFTQFGWDDQVFAWCECISFLIYLTKHYTLHESQDGPHPVKISSALTNSTIEVHQPSKRRRLSSSSKNASSANDKSNQEELLLALKSAATIQSSEAADLISNFVFNAANQNAVQIWSLVSRCADLLSNLILNPVYAEKLQTAWADPLGMGMVYGLLVKQMVKLMLSIGSQLMAVRYNKSRGGRSELWDCANRTVGCFNSILVQIMDSVPSRVFISMVSDLFDSSDRGLCRKSLDLLSSKLTTLTESLTPHCIVPNLAKVNYHKIVKRQKKHTSRPRVSLDYNMESGLVHLTNKLASMFEAGVTFGSEYCRQSLFCLRDLSKLLANRYPGEFMRTMDNLISNPTYWWPKSTATSSKKSALRGTSLAESRSLVCLLFVECLQNLPLETLYPEASATLQRLTWIMRFALDHAITSAGMATTPRLSINETESFDVGTLQSRDQHLQASLTLISNLLELAIVHRLSQRDGQRYISQESLVGQWLQFDSAKSSSQDELTSAIMLRLVFELSQANLANVTGCNPERSMATLHEISQQLDHIRKLFTHVTNLKHLLHLILHIIETNMGAANKDILNGALAFLSEFGARVAPTSTNGNLTQGNTSHREEFDAVASSSPQLLPRLITSMLNASDDACSTDVICDAVASLLCVQTDATSRLKLCQSVVEWAVSVTKSGADGKMTRRLSVMLTVFERMHIHMDVEEYVDVTKQLLLIDYVVFVFGFAIDTNNKDVKKLAKRLNLPDILPSSPDSTTTLNCIHSSLKYLNQWLLCQTACNAGLDSSAGFDALVNLPASLASLLKFPSNIDSLPPVIETSLQPVIKSFLKAVSGDEAFIRPLGSCLSHQIMHSQHWRTRVAAIRLLKFLFDELQSTDTVDFHDTAHCLVSDTLVALGEALEDGNAEVEVEANRLFAQMDQMGLTSRSTDRAESQQMEVD